MKDYEATLPPDRLADRVQLHTAFSTERGTVTKFMVQLEYWLEGDWRDVVRYDHDRDAPGGHDITEEGLHRDIYRDREKIDSHELTPPLPANDTLNAAEEHLTEHLQGDMRRFEEWYGINP